MIPPDIKKIFADAARLLRTRGWTRGVPARRKDGIETHPTSRSACRFCVLGALRKVSPSLFKCLVASTVLRDALPRPTTFWNDKVVKSKWGVIHKLEELAK